MNGAPRVGDYRIVYTIDDAKRLVEVTRIRHRRDVYDGWGSESAAPLKAPPESRTKRPAFTPMVK